MILNVVTTSCGREGRPVWFFFDFPAATSLSIVNELLVRDWTIFGDRLEVDGLPGDRVVIARRPTILTVAGIASIEEARGRFVEGSR